MKQRKDRRVKQWCKTAIRAAGGDNSAGQGEIDAYTYDLSLCGARIHTETYFEVGRILQLRIELVRSREILTVDGQVKWLRRNNVDRTYEIGVEFLHSTSQTIMGLMKNLHDVIL